MEEIVQWVTLLFITVVNIVVCHRLVETQKKMDNICVFSVDVFNFIIQRVRMDCETTNLLNKIACAALNEQGPFKEQGQTTIQ